MRLLLLAISLLLCSNAWGDDRFWVGGGATSNWNEAGGGVTNWGTASNTQDNASVPANGDDVFFDGVGTGAADCVVNTQTAILNSFDMTGYANTLSGTSQIRISGSPGTTQNCIFDGTITWTGNLSLQPGSSTSFINFTTNGTLFTTISILTGGGTDLVILQDNLSFSASKTNYILLGNSGIDLNGKTISGNSATNRLLISSSTLGTARPITISGGTFANCDFRDIAFDNGGGGLDLSGITGGSGDCGGNQIDDAVTFTTADDLYWVAGTGNWSDGTNHWSTSSGGAAGARVPLPQDTCYFDNGSDSGNFTVTADMPRLGKTIDTSGYTDASTFTLAINSVDMTIYGGLDLSGIDTLTEGNKNIYFEGRGVFDITSGGISFASTNINIQMIGGTWKLTDNFTHTLRNFNFSNGTIDTATNDVDISTYGLASNNSNARALNIGSSGFSISGNGNDTRAVDLRTTTNLTITSLPSINLTGVQASSAFTRFETSADYSFSTTNIVISGGPSDGGWKFMQGNTFNTFTINAPKTVKFTAGTTTTVNSFVATGSAGNNINLLSTTTDIIATISDADGGTNINDYLVVNDIVATQANTFYYGANGSADAESLNWLSVPVSGRRIFLIQ